MAVFACELALISPDTYTKLHDVDAQLIIKSLLWFALLNAQEGVKALVTLGSNFTSTFGTHTHPLAP